MIVTALSEFALAIQLQSVSLSDLRWKDLFNGIL